MPVALELNHVWKKFHRGEFNDCLRDAIPAFFKSIAGFGPSRSELSAKDFWALSDIDFKVEEGERLGIIGHNGAGKSTLLKVLSQIIAPNRGSMKVHGRLRALIEVGAGFHGDLTGRENIYLNGAILGMTRQEIDRNFDSIVDFSGVEAFLDTPVKRYSSGMAARLGFAVAAHLEPDILIVDEVLSVGDSQFQKKCLGKMKDVANTGRTVLFVSHNMAAVRQLCSRAILLKKGELIDDGAPEDVIGRYLKGWDEEGSARQRDHYELRAGDGRARIKKVLLGNSPDQLSPVYIADIGRELFVEVEYESFAPVQNPVIQVVFGNVMDYVFEINTYITPRRLSKLKKSGKILFHIPEVQLSPGEYPLYVTIKEQGAFRGSLALVDEWTQAALLNVSAQNMYGYDLSKGYYGRTFSHFSWLESTADPIDFELE